VIGEISAIVWTPVTCEGLFACCPVRAFTAVCYRALQEAQEIFGIDFDFEEFEQFGEDEEEEEEDEEEVSD